MKTKQEESKSRRKWSADEKINIIRWQFNRSKLVEASEEFRVHPNLERKDLTFFSFYILIFYDTLNTMILYSQSFWLPVLFLILSVVVVLGCGYFIFQKLFFEQDETGLAALAIII